MDDTTDLDALAFNFFREFARSEYCLKAVGLLKPEKPNSPEANWIGFADEVADVLRAGQDGELGDAINYYLARPPKKQALVNGKLGWVETLPDHKTPAQLVLLLVGRVRNNLFHGGKFNGYWFEPQRSEELLKHGMTILQAVIEAHPKTRQAYAEKAPLA